MASINIRVDSEVMEQMLLRCAGKKTANQIMRELLGLSEMAHPHGGAVKKSIKTISPYLNRAEVALLKGLRELRKLREDA